MSLKHIFESEGVPLYKTECEHGKEILLNAFRFRAGVKVIVISQISLHLPQRMRSTPRSIQSHLKDSLKKLPSCFNQVCVQEVLPFGPFWRPNYKTANRKKNKRSWNFVWASQTKAIWNGKKIKRWWWKSFVWVSIVRKWRKYVDKQDKKHHSVQLLLHILFTCILEATQWTQTPSLLVRKFLACSHSLGLCHWK